LADDERGLGRGADGEGIIKGTHHRKVEPVIDRTAVSVCWAGFSRAVIASHAFLFVLTSLSVCHQHSPISVCPFVTAALHKLLGIIELPVRVLCGRLVVFHWAWDTKRVRQQGD